MWAVSSLELWSQTKKKGGGQFELSSNIQLSLLLDYGLNVTTASYPCSQDFSTLMTCVLEL